MSSSIGEAKKQLAAADEEAQKAVTAIGSAAGSTEDALKLVKEAADDSGHEDVEKAVKSLEKALEAFEDAQKLIKEAREAAERYAKSLG